MPSASTTSCGNPTTPISPRPIPTRGGSSNDPLPGCRRTNGRKCCTATPRHCIGFREDEWPQRTQSNSCTNRYNTANENELRHVQSNDGKSPNGPLCQRGRAEG